MKKLFLFLLMFIFIVGFVNAQGNYSGCLDTTPPEAVTGLSINGNVHLSWDEAEDFPECSYISHYEVYRDGVLLANVVGLSYDDGPLENGAYDYNVIAVDAANPPNKGSPTGKSYTVGGTSDQVGDTGGGGGGGSGGGGGGAGAASPVVDDGDTSSSSDNDSLGDGDSDNGLGLETASFGDTQEEDSSFLSGITGFFLGSGGSGNWWVLILLVAAILIGWYLWKKDDDEGPVSSGDQGSIVVATSPETSEEVSSESSVISTEPSEEKKVEESSDEPQELVVSDDESGGEKPEEKKSENLFDEIP